MDVGTCVSDGRYSQRPMGAAIGPVERYRSARTASTGWSVERYRSACAARTGWSVERYRSACASGSRRVSEATLDVAAKAGVEGADFFARCP